VLAPGGDHILASSFWESVYPTEDLIYVENTLKDVLTRYRSKLDPKKIYAVGFSSGGLFSWNLMVKYGGTVFAGISNVMGGVQWSPNTYTGYLQVTNRNLVCPTLILTGTNDNHLEMCKKAAEFAKDVFPVTLQILEGVSHSYTPEVLEPLIWNFLKGCELHCSQPLL